MQLFYNADISPKITEFTFNKEESRHIIKVLRKKEGDTIQLINGKGLLFNSEVVIANEKKCFVQITSCKEIPKQWDYHLHIAIAPTKMNDRYEWFLEKATEIGIDEITPIICDNSERKIIKHDRMKKVIISAMKQSLKFHLPIWNSPTTFSEFLENDIKGAKFIAHCEDSDKKNLSDQIKNTLNITILIGPEGDFSTKEISNALQHQFIPLSLGKSRLRTETAGIVACNTVSILKNNAT